MTHLNIKIFIISLLLINAVSSAEVETRKANNGNLVMQDIPEIPQQIVDNLNQYQNVRSAPFSGFSEDGLLAFGKGKRVICMDGLDISEMLQHHLAFKDVLSKKVRRAAETGQPFVRLRDLL